ncbi:hypothetical protein SU69_04790 [Thermosipho melanesiensis]|uniref:Uncharacterized protein n=3 Tax=Thermosipho melanesiensis TaxID=46541 RepID=A6LLJ6_THEM4|nr:hypothetical protein [Thermosipho melanesiensis]ABR30797.1 hypothetical protein Tmel_0936 [Thermosipho melanesiensis BI429]APT73918.1 hypothetical protein BW47_05025 [Thermosipho melanesiensis]OOC35856.1 hypothetical protein SU68_04845 [Thermosipho melanesiensis]OOC38358.1 hypothetical protein SU69_04790 [Thermosipho melanesiensis]OOC38819.1 hypothetical protein SU70_04790 [Thermosipho melanesiensis]
MGITLQASGVIFFVGDNITEEASKIIQDWFKQPVVSLYYEGPLELKPKIEEYFYKRGYLIGIGEPIYIFIKKHEGKIAWKIIYKDYKVDNFLSLSYSIDDLFSILDKTFKKFNLPKKSIAYDPEEEKYYIAENQIKPFLIKRKEKIYKVKIGEDISYLKEGFYNFNGNTVYVGKDITLDSTSNFIKDIYVYGKYKYNGEKIIFEDKTIDFPEVPLYIDKQRVISSHYWYENQLIENSEVVLDVFKKMALLSDGSLVDLSKTWKYQLPDTPFDWYLENEKLALAFVNGDVLVFDIRKKRILYTQKFEKLLGVGLKDFLYVNSNGKLLKINIISKKMESLGNIKGDFIIDGENVKFVNGIVIRPRYKGVWYDGTFYHFKNLKVENYLNLLYDDKAYYIFTLDGTWRLIK